MSRFPHRVVIDTNVVLRGLINPNSVSGRILDLCDRRHVVPVLSKEVVTEYRYILTDPKIVNRYPQLEARKVEVALTRFRFVADVVQVRARFAYPRDPKDSKLLELAIDTHATHLLKSDADLLDLPVGHGEASRRFRQRLPTLHVVQPAEFLHRCGL